MTPDIFAALNEVLRTDGAEHGLAYLGEQFLASKEYGLLFEARLMQKRREMGLPLIQTDTLSTDEYQAAVVEAAREAGRLFLADGNIERAWPYYRAVGDPSPVAHALNNVEPRENMEGLIAIAFQEGVNPLKGLGLILAQHGMCRAITAFGMTAVTKDRPECIALLATSLHAEIVSRMSAAIEAHEGTASSETNLPALMQGRDWLFGEWDYYVDTSHLLSIIPYCVEIEDLSALNIFAELCDYGTHLSAQFQSPGVPPFENQCVAYGHYVQALLGNDTEDHLGYFRKQIADADPEVTGDAPGRALVKLLVSLNRPAEALDVLLNNVFEDDPYGALIPSALSLCYQARDYERLKSIAHERGDLLSYTAAAILSNAAAGTPSQIPASNR